MAAYLLKREGFEVVGVTFQLYDYSRQNRKEGKGGCCSIEDIQDTRGVCEKLGIKHFLFDTREHFKKRVMDYFADSYRRGETPNPCVACNTFIKFDELEYYANHVGAEFFATGHYARTVRDDAGVHLERAKDLSKDQSYFLVGVGREKLNRCYFPVGDYEKSEIRQMALELDLPVSQKKDSMEVCFIPENDYRKFLRTEYQFEAKSGSIVNESGEVLASHGGTHEFTIGQKKGLADYGLHHFYVIDLKPAQNLVVVGPASRLLSDGVRVKGDFLLEPFGSWVDVSVKIRSRAEPIAVRSVTSDGGTWTAQFETPQRAVTPGQFAVFYQGSRVIGGGPILGPVSNLSDHAGASGGHSEKAWSAV